MTIMKTQKLMLIVGVLLSVAPSIFPVWAAQDEYTGIKEMFEKLNANKKVDRIVETKIPGLYEVSSGAEVLYSSKDGRYILAGDLFNMEDRINLTEQTRSMGRLALLKDIESSNMIVFAPKKVKHTITIFTDIDCGFCRKLHSQMADYNERGIEIRYLVYPRAGIDSPSYNKAVAVSCAKDRREALTRAKRGDVLENKTCKNPIKANMLLAERFGITGTPTLVLEDGSVVGGYLEPAKLSEALDGISAKAK